MKSSDFRKQINLTLSELDSTVSDLQSGYDETVRVRKVVENTKEILDDLDMQFCQKTGLQGNDIAFLFAAVGLQLLRITIINELTKIEPAGTKNKLENGLHDFQDKIMDRLSNLILYNRVVDNIAKLSMK